MSGRFLCLFVLAVCLCRMAAAAPEQWIEIRSAHFTVLTDAGEKDGRQIADQFERMRWLFQAMFPKANVDPAGPIVVVAAKNEKAFDALEPAAYLKRGQMKLGGLYLHTPDKNYILLQLGAEYDHPFATVYHEYTHVQFEGAADWLPLWLNEGLAMFMQNTIIDDKDVRLGEPSSEEVLYLRQHQLIPLDVLFKVDYSSPYYHEEQKGSVFYAESWALTHYLMMTDREKHTHVLEDYMALLVQKQDPVAAAEKTFGDLQSLRATLESYIHHEGYRVMTISSAAAPLDESSYKVRPLTAVEADAARADVLAYVGRGNDARALLKNVLEEDPENVQANETMGFLAIQAQDRSEALKYYGQAVKLKSQDYLAHYYFAAISMEEADAAEDPAIAESLRTAIRLNPRFAPAYDSLASFYLKTHSHLEEAHVLNAQAVQLDPGNVAYRMNTAGVLAAMQRYSDAVNVLKIAEKLAKTPDDVAMVQKRIKTIEEFQAAQAREGSSPKEQTAANTRLQAEMQATKPAAGIPPGPKHPTAPATGNKYFATGVMRDVACSYPAILEFRVEYQAGKSVTLYNNDFFKVELTAIGFNPKGAVNPCTDFEGKTAQVTYVESPDKTVDGQVMAIEIGQ